MSALRLLRGPTALIVPLAGHGAEKTLGHTTKVSHRPPSETPLPRAETTAAATQPTPSHPDSQQDQIKHGVRPPVLQLVVTGFWRLLRSLDGMGTSGSAEYRARRRGREQQRRQQSQRTTPKARSEPGVTDVRGPERRTAATACGWCGGPITPGRRGPIPKWCSATCRHRAWEQARAAASGRSAVELVERRVEVQVPLVPTRRDWPRLLGELAGQLNDGRVYDRDLPALARALQPVLEAYRRRAHLTGALDVR